MMQKKQSAKPLAPHGKRPQAPHQVRIIGGMWKRTPLAVIDAEGLRPTPDRVRETVFNWLGHLLNAQWQGLRCLDLFAGTGALGFEAASRGVAQVTMIEGNAKAARQLEATRTKLNAAQVTILRGDAFALAQSLSSRIHAETERFDVIFLDPPYHQDWLSRMLPVCERLLSNEGYIYVESEFAFEEANPPVWLQSWTTVRADKAGMVYYRLLRRNSLPDFQA